MFKKHNGLNCMNFIGNCWGDSVAESFLKFGNGRCFSSIYQIREDAKRDIVDYTEMFYNSNKWCHSYLSYCRSIEFEK